ncbi:ras-related protein Rab-21-like [Halichondria panicea]|uniref:ras-related protein Rab-21-like n=1 Tax=Halichondria panicea TaxID=6063 RepID=UPI00312BBA3A
MASQPRTGTVKAKVVLLGEGAVGKTSIVLRYVENRFNDRHDSTLQASFLQRTLNIGPKRIQLAIWDTAGQERFHALGPIYYRDAQGAIVVYDITDVDSFTKAKNWIKELRRIVGEDIAVCIVGNKIDLEKNRTVLTTEAESYAASVGATHFSTSAKQNKGIQELFLDLSKRIIDSGLSAQQPKNDKLFAAQTTGRRSIIVEDDFSQPAETLVSTDGGSKCC